MPPFPPLDRQNILARFPWAAQPNLNMVAGTDLDATLSSLLAHHVLGWQVVGFYDLTTIYRAEGVSWDDVWNAVWLDLDIYNPEIKSIGHHILTLDASPMPGHRQSLNPNLERGVTRREFGRKYPLATFHFLCWLWDIAPAAPPALLWLPDSTWVNARRYGENVAEWLTNGPPALRDTLPAALAPDFAASVEALGRQFARIGWPRGGGASGWQCRFDAPVPHALDRLYAVLAALTGWPALRCPPRFETLSGTRRAVPLAAVHPLANAALAQFLADAGAFSYVLPTYGMLNVTAF